MTFSVSILPTLTFFLLFEINVFLLLSLPLPLKVALYFYFSFDCMPHSFVVLLESLNSFSQFPKSRWLSSVKVSALLHILFFCFLYLSSPLYFISSSLPLLCFSFSFSVNLLVSSPFPFTCSCNYSLFSTSC